MANYKIVDADRLDADMTGLADVIRQRAGTAGKLEFPEEMKEAVRNIPGGVELPALDNPGTAGDLALGKQFIDENGNAVTGTVEDGASWIYQRDDEVDAFYDYEDEGNLCFHHTFEKDVLYRKGGHITLAYHDIGDAQPGDVAKGTTFTSAYGVNIEGTMEPGSGGSEAVLNFEVVGGTAAPANPSENTIWMNTDQNITGWYLSHSEPTEPSEGMAWICLGAFGDTEFNALKENGIQIFLIAGYQYINHVWEKKPIECYQNGEWVEFTKILLFNSGNQFVDLTGGWKAVNAGITIIIDDGIKASITGTSRDASAYTQNHVDISDYATLACIVNLKEGSRNFSLGLTTANTDAYPKVWIAKTQLSNVSGEQEVRVNISDISGFYYIGAHFDVSEGTVSSVWLER